MGKSKGEGRWLKGGGRNGKRKSADFWIHYQGKYVSIQYFAIRDRQGNYLGTLEVSQEISGIKKIEGERRLLDLNP